MRRHGGRVVAARQRQHGRRGRALTPPPCLPSPPLWPPPPSPRPSPPPLRRHHRHRPTAQSAKEPITMEHGSGRLDQQTCLDGPSLPVSTLCASHITPHHTTTVFTSEAHCYFGSYMTVTSVTLPLLPLHFCYRPRKCHGVKFHVK